MSICIVMLCVLFNSIGAKEFSDKESSLKRMQSISVYSAEASKLFSRLNLLNTQIHKSTSFAAAHLGQNRNEGFLPYDETRCCKEIKNFYVSASDIITPKQNYIIAQAPLPSTVCDFWRMIFYKKCVLIVTACMPIESNRDRCTPFWRYPYLPQGILNWQLYLNKEEILREGPKSQKIVKRYLQAYNRKTHEKRTIIQLHLENWPDYGIPDLSIFNEFLDLVDQCSINSKSPILVHCSAGIGRSGTFVAAHSLRKEILSGKNQINIPQRIFDLRLQRGELVTTVKQFQFIYKVLLPFLVI